jgi:hypothetical protein
MLITVLIVGLLVAGCGGSSTSSPPTTTTPLPPVTPTIVETVARCLTAARVPNRELSIPSMSRLPVILVPRGRQASISFFRSEHAATVFLRRLNSRGSRRVASAVYEPTGVQRIDRAIRRCLDRHLTS